jgi:predicted Zn-dependent protease
LEILEGAKRRERESHHEPVADLDFLRGDALARLGRYADAQQAFEEEIRAFPANSQAWARLAVVYGLQHRTIREVDHLLEGMMVANPTPETAEIAAKTLESMGDRRGAQAWRRRAVPRPAE